VLITIESVQLLIDTSVDFRQQCLRYGVNRLDAILFTHAHADHVFGLDDIRALNRLDPKKKIPCYANEKTIHEIRQIYSYVFEYPDLPGGIPMIDLITIDEPFPIGNVMIRPIAVMHGRIPVLAFRIGDFVYMTDTSFIPESAFEHLQGVHTLVLDCLRFRPHPTHFNLEQSLAAVQRIKPKQTYFTHISHDLEHHAVSAQLPDHVFLAYDGLRITV
jgi:phosphoribosyl 1,2-cyclic phosphate phosphodiesterase